VGFLVLLAATAAFAQQPAHPHRGETPSVTLSGAVHAVSSWTRKEWLAAKAKWSQEKSKWAACQREASRKKLSGRSDWSFLYDCMTK
jgi:hypothetical protein